MNEKLGKIFLVSISIFLFFNPSLGAMPEDSFDHSFFATLTPRTESNPTLEKHRENIVSEVKLLFRMMKTIHPSLQEEDREYLERSFMRTIVARWNNLNESEVRGETLKTDTQ